MKDEYPDGKSDLFAAFIERCTNLAGPRGAVAMITMQSWMFLSSYEKLRVALLTKQRITSMLHLGARAFDSIGGEVVSSTAFVLANMPPEARGSDQKCAGTFVRLVDGTSEAEKVAALGEALQVRSKAVGFHLASDADFIAIPGSPIVYWLSENMRSAFVKAASRGSLGDAAGIAQGITTGDNGRFLRLWWEVSADESEFNRDYDSTTLTRRWQAADKGGDFRQWFGNNDWVIFWPDDGSEIVNFAGSTPRNIHTRFKPSIACTKISSGGISFRAHDRGFVFTDASVAATRDGDLDSILGFVNSSTAHHMMAALAPTLNFEVGQIRSLPWLVDTHDESTLGRTVRQLKSNSIDDWNAFETSWDFEGNSLIALTC
mgnify:CR=1 FL=1